MNETTEMWADVRKDVQAHRARMLEKADTTGWEALSPYQFRRNFGQTRVDWWPSGGKAMVWEPGQKQGRMVYTHRKVNALIARLKAQEPQP
jgi:hypothetical protein